MRDFPPLKLKNRFECLSRDEGEECNVSASTTDAEVATVHVKPTRTPRTVSRRRAPRTSVPRTRDMSAGVTSSTPKTEPEARSNVLKEGSREPTNG